MSQYDFERSILTSIENVKHQLLNRPLNLGGVFSGDGGSGGPPGGFIGSLPQSRVTFDTTEAETWEYPVTASGIPSGVSLVHNLNRIRYRLAQLEAGSGSGGHTIQSSGATFTQRTNLKFEGLVTVTDDVINDATVVTVISGYPTITVSSTEPSNPSVGDIWVVVSG